jgi:hypothetical protein
MISTGAELEHTLNGLSLESTIRAEHLDAAEHLVRAETMYIAADE